MYYIEFEHFNMIFEQIHGTVAFKKFQTEQIRFE